MPVVKNPAALVALAMLVLSVLAAILAVWVLALVRLAERKPLLPREPRRIVPWGTGTILATLLVYVLVQFAAVASYRYSAHGRAVAAAAKAKGEPPEISNRDRLLLSVAMMGGLIVLVPPTLRLTSGARLADLGLTTRRLPRNLALGAAACVFLLPVVYAAQFAALRIWERNAHLVEQALAADLSVPMAAIVVLLAVVAAPLVEEVLFRGVLLGWLWKGSLARPTLPEVAFSDEWRDPLAPPEPATLPPPVEATASSGPMDLAANVAVSLLFAGLHFEQWPAPVPLFLLSLGLGEVYRRTGSLAAPIALHATFNGLSTAAMMLVAASGIKP